MAVPFEASLAALPQRDRYKLLCGVVVPRPIALVTSQNTAGVVNAAPFSFFNVFSEEPPLVVLGLQTSGGGEDKDTTRNIREDGEFVVNLVDEGLAEAMNVCAVDFPHHASEIEAAGLGLSPSSAVKPPRIAEAPVGLECRRHTMLSFGPERDLVIGEIVHLHARAGIVDPETLYVDLDVYKPIGRLFANLYWRNGEVFELRRETYAEWLARSGGE